MSDDRMVLTVIAAQTATVVGETICFGNLLTILRESMDWPLEYVCFLYRWVSNGNA